MLRSRFESLPVALNERLIPSDKNKSKGFRAAFSRKPKVFISSMKLGFMSRLLFISISLLNKQYFSLIYFGFQASGDEKEEEKRAARFAQMWNLIITSFREEDLIDNREMDLLLVPYCKDRELNIFQWPPFLLASKVYTFAHSVFCLLTMFVDSGVNCLFTVLQIPIALDMAADSGGKDRDLTKRIGSDPYFSYAIRECYASFKNIINTLVFGQREKLCVLSYQDCYLLILLFWAECNIAPNLI